MQGAIVEGTENTGIRTCLARSPDAGGIRRNPGLTSPGFHCVPSGLRFGVVCGIFFVSEFWVTILKFDQHSGQKRSKAVFLCALCG